MCGERMCTCAHVLHQVATEADRAAIEFEIAALQECVHPYVVDVLTCSKASARAFDGSVIAWVQVWGGCVNCCGVH